MKLDHTTVFVAVLGFINLVLLLGSLAAIVWVVVDRRREKNEGTGKNSPVPTGRHHHHRDWPI